MDGLEGKRCVVNGRGKLPRISQACGNRRFTISGRFEKWGAWEGPGRPTEAADGPLRGREWGD